MSLSNADARSFFYNGPNTDTHSVVHNLNSQFVAYTAYVTVSGVEVDPANVISVTATDVNTLTIILTAPAAISVRVVT